MHASLFKRLSCLVEGTEACNILHGTLASAVYVLYEAALGCGLLGYHHIYYNITHFA